MRKRKINFYKVRSFIIQSFQNILFHRHKKIFDLLLNFSQEMPQSDHLM